MYQTGRLILIIHGIERQAGGHTNSTTLSLGHRALSHADKISHIKKNSANGGREIVGYAHPGVLCKADSLIVELAANILALLREDWTGNRALLIRFESVLGKLGMSPADRSKVSVFKTKSANPYAEFG